MRGRAISITTFAWLALATGARADALDYSAPEGCPTRAEFERRLQSRGRTLPTEPLRMIVRITDQHATLTLREGASVVGERSLDASSCDEATHALAFVAALLLEEHARSEPTPKAPRVRASAPAVAPDPPPSPVEQSDPVEDTAVVEQTPALEERPRPVEAPVEPPSDAHWHAGFGVAALVAHGLAPKPRPGLAVQAQLGWEWLDLALGVRTMLPHEATSPEGHAEFRWTSASLDACAAATWHRVRPALCVDVELGRIRARGSDTDAPRDVRSPWFALGPRLDLRMRLWGPLQLAVALGVPVPLTRDRFTLGPTTLHRVPAVTFRAAIRLALDFE